MPTILIADDNEDSRDIYATLFEFGGYRVLKAEDGLAALSLLLSERPDLIVLNLSMPHLSGHDVLEHLRSNPDTAHIPCLIFTGDARFEQLGRAVVGGADGFLTKPAEPMDVLKFVRELLGDVPPGLPAQS